VATYQVAAVWDAVGDGTRRAILEQLTLRPQAVGELAEHLPVSRPAVSQHLRILKDAGLVDDEPAGTRRIYRVDPRGLTALRSDIDRFWTQALDSFKTTVEHETERGR
jgi:DNA-binding transcriptional ArsR family regulator